MNGLEITKGEAQDFVLDCYNAIKKLREIDNTVWEPVRVEDDGRIFSMIDGRLMGEHEFLKKWPSGTWIRS